MNWSKVTVSFWMTPANKTGVASVLRYIANEIDKTPTKKKWMMDCLNIRIRKTRWPSIKEVKVEEVNDDLPKYKHGLQEPEVSEVHSSGRGILPGGLGSQTNAQYTDGGGEEGNH